MHAVANARDVRKTTASALIGRQCAENSVVVSVIFRSHPSKCFNFHVHLFSDCQNRGESNHDKVMPLDETTIRPSLVFEPVERNIELVVDDDDDIQYDQCEASYHIRSLYILRNVFDLSAHRILTKVKACIENNCDESTIIRYALDAFKEQIYRINRTFSTSADQP